MCWDRKSCSWWWWWCKLFVGGGVSGVEWRRRLLGNDGGCGSVATEDDDAVVVVVVAEGGGKSRLAIEGSESRRHRVFLPVRSGRWSKGVGRKTFGMGWWAGAGRVLCMVGERLSNEGNDDECVSLCIDSLRSSGWKEGGCCSLTVAVVSIVYKTLNKGGWTTKWMCKAVADFLHTLSLTHTLLAAAPMYHYLQHAHYQSRFFINASSLSSITKKNTPEQLRRTVYIFHKATRMTIDVCKCRGPMQVSGGRLVIAHLTWYNMHMYVCRYVCICVYCIVYWSTRTIIILSSLGLALEQHGTIATNE